MYNIGNNLIMCIFIIYFMKNSNSNNTISSYYFYKTIDIGSMHTVVTQLGTSYLKLYIGT
jgi:hypothetical protein